MLLRVSPPYRNCSVNEQEYRSWLNHLFAKEIVTASAVITGLGLCRNSIHGLYSPLCCIRGLYKLLVKALYIIAAQDAVCCCGYRSVVALQTL